MGIGDFLRRRWYWILGVIVAFTLFIINPLLFVFIIAVSLLVYFLFFRRRRREEGVGNTVRVKVGVVRDYGVFDIGNLRLRKVCFSVGVGDGVVRVGDNWIAALWLGFLDSALMSSIAGLGALISDGSDNYLVIYGSDVNDVFVRLNTAVELIRTRNVVFRQLSSSELISRVVFRWAS
jgi:hypothetical protein